MSKWIEIKETGKSKSGKTSIYEVVAKEGSVLLGTIKWHGPWRKYAFFPQKDTLFENDCLEDIVRFLKEAKNKPVKESLTNIDSFDLFEIKHL